MQILNLDRYLYLLVSSLGRLHIVHSNMQTKCMLRTFNAFLVNILFGSKVPSTIQTNFNIFEILFSLFWAWFSIAFTKISQNKGHTVFLETLRFLKNLKKVYVCTSKIIMIPYSLTAVHKMILLYNHIFLSTTLRN